MQIPLQIVAQGLELSAGTQEIVRAYADKLETFFGRVMGCRVTVSVPNRWPQAGPIVHRVRVDLTVPGAELVVKRQPNPDLLDAIQDAFRVAGRRLQDYARRLPPGLSPSPESRAVPARARIVRIFPWEGFGFLGTPDGREIYFHCNSVLHNQFDQLQVGQEVRYTEEEGIEGPQASSLEIPGRRRVRRKFRAQG